MPEDNIDISDLSANNQALVRRLVARMRANAAPPRKARPLAFAPIEPKPDFVWCTQCERRVAKPDAERCKSAWCGAKIAYEVTR